jgi:hypothetical protein
MATAKAVTVPDGVTLDTKGFTLAATTLKVDGTVKLDKTAAPTGNVTVGATGEIAVSGANGSLTIAKSATLDIADKGKVTLTNTGSLVLAGDSANGAKLTGAGKVIAGATEIVGGTNGWQAVGASGNVTIAAGVTAAAKEATITANTSVLTGVTGGTGATITQLAGEGNKLTIATGTKIDVVNAGSIVLKAATSDGGKMNLATTSAEISGLTGGTSNQTFTNANIANATYTAGSSDTSINGTASSGGTDGVIKGGGNGGTNLITATDSATDDAVISKDTLIGAN